jgi:stage II sporulation protein D
VEGENLWADQATAATAGMVMTWNAPGRPTSTGEGRLFPSYFHSTCGGATTSAQRVWNERPIAPLCGVDCPWCKASPYWRWTARVSAADIAEALARANVQDVASVTGVQPLDSDASHYARHVLVNGALKLDANTFRLAVGGRLLRSAAFEVKPQDGAFEFAGRGWGHGVGLCQWGARGMAEAGYAWQDILKHYYPGASIAHRKPR